MKSNSILITMLLIVTFSIGIALVTAGYVQRGGDLEGTSWQLVKFQLDDGTTLTPDDRSKYTITFGTNGYASVRVDCNRGGGPWKYRGSNQIQFGSMSISRAKCGAGSLHDRIVRDGAAVRNYTIKDGRLFLSLPQDGAYYELEPLQRSPGRKRTE